ncbi:MAG: hypothetical protein H0U58_08130, partial [Chloroflexi bacterium]|nr:hypothetical protein [Chloroflexota bacterium]
MTSPQPGSLDDVAVGPAAGGDAPDPADPLAVFRIDHLPGWALVRHRFARTEVEDVDEAVDAAFATMVQTIPSGSRVCLAVGSRGIDRIAEVTRAAVRNLR